MNKQNSNSVNSNLFKGKYLIAFYKEDDETIVAVFDNLKEIIAYRGEEVTYESYATLKCHLYKALKRENHYTRMLDGSPMHVYLEDPQFDEDDDLDFEKKK